MLQLKNLLKTGVGTAGAQLITLASIPILSRIYAPEDFAVYAVYFTLISIFGLIANLRYAEAIVIADTDRKALSLLSLSFWASVAVGIISVIAAKYSFEAWYPELGLSTPDFLVVVFFHVLSMGILLAIRQWFVRAASFFIYAGLNLLMALAVPIAQWAFKDHGLPVGGGLVVGAAIGNFFVAVICMLLMAGKRVFFISESVSNLLDVMKENKNFPLFLVPYTVFGVVRTRAIYLVLGMGSDKVIAGHYAQSDRLVNSPNGLLSNTLRPVFFNFAAKKGIHNIHEQLFQLLKVLVVSIVPIWLWVVFYAEEIVVFILGDGWKGAVVIFQWLAFPALIMLLTNWLDRGYDVVGKQKVSMYLELIFGIGSIFILYLLVLERGQPMCAIKLMAVFSSLYLMVWAQVLFFLIGFPLEKSIKLFVTLALVIVASYFFVVYLATMMDGLYQIGGSAAGVVLFSLVYLIVSYRQIRG